MLTILADDGNNQHDGQDHHHHDHDHDDDAHLC